jgi:hypothetical protein
MSRSLNMSAFPRRLVVVMVVTAVTGWPRAGDGGAPAAVPELVPVGVAKVDITPGTPVRMYGYGARKTESEGVAGRLHAAALAIGGDEGHGAAVLLTVDCGAVPDDMRQELLRRVQAKTGLRPERFMLCNAHIHSGPDLKGMKELEGEQREHLVQYARQITDRLTEVVQQALAARRPGRLAWTQGKVGFAANRRVLKDGKWTGFGAVPEGAVDHSLPVLRVTDAAGRLLAVVVNYACHNTTLRGNFRQIHADWAGCAQEFIEADQPGAVALVTLGCGADADPCPHGTVELCQRHGRALADEVKRLLVGQFQPLNPRLSANLVQLQVPYAPAPSIEQLRQAAPKSYPLQGLLRRLERGEQPPTAEPYTIAVWAFGDDLAMVFLSHEVVVDYALRMKRQFHGQRLWINAYCHDVSGYIASDRLLREGGYEVNNSLSARVTYGRPEQLRPSLEERIVEQVRAALPAVYSSPETAQEQSQP